MQVARTRPSTLFIAAIAFFFAGWNQSAGADEDMSNHQGLYLGETAPGSTPQLFAPGSISRPDYFEHSGAVFSPDLREVYWSAKPNDERYYNIYYMKMIGDRWTAPKVAPFAEHNYGERSGQLVHFNKPDTLNLF